MGAWMMWARTRVWSCLGCMHGGWCKDASPSVQMFSGVHSAHWPGCIHTVHSLSVCINAHVPARSQSAPASQHLATQHRLLPCKHVSKNLIFSKLRCMHDKPLTCVALAGACMPARDLRAACLAAQYSALRCSCSGAPSYSKDIAKTCQGQPQVCMCTSYI